ncbi:MAG: hypothetical protein HKUEN02_05310 [Anaerolineaceae bacterium]|nr:MAG: hypothetical protein HKUEN02_05310 [Anaerolineaceae bacterium]
MDLNGFTAVLGVLGAYFVILMVLSMSVEALLEPITQFRGLRKQVSPDDVLASVEEWLPEGSDEMKKVVAIETFTAQTRTNLEALNQSVTELRNSAVKALTEMGMEAQINTVQKDIALKLVTLRQMYLQNEKRRITTLRVISAVIGVILAFLLRINSFEILGALFPAYAGGSLNTPIGHIGGMLITGLATSAGSSFWHDMLGRVRNLKNLSGQAQTLLDNVSKPVG